MAESFQEKYESVSVVECARQMVALKEQIDEIKKLTLNPLQAEHDSLKYSIIPDKMDEMEVSTLNIKELGRVTVSNTLGVTTIKEKKAELYEWLKEEGYEDLIVPTVNSSTLAAFVREQIKEGNELPYECINITPSRVASVTKK